MSQNNDTVQKFISRSEYNTSRQRILESRLQNIDKKGDSVLPNNTEKYGYLPSLLDYLLSVRAADSIAVVAAGIIFNNRTLSRMVVSPQLVHFVTGILRKYGPSQKLMGLFSAMISGSHKHVSKNQSIILEVVCSTTADPIYIDNRRHIMIESQLHNDDVYVTWSGSAQYIRGRSIDAELFYDAESLDLKTRILSSPEELQEYLTRLRATSRRDIKCQWTKLSALAWYIDPENCYYFWKLNPSVAWRKYLDVKTAEDATMNKHFRENLENLRSLCQHYLGVIELYSNLCIER